MRNQTVGVSYSHSVEQTFAVAATTRLLDTVAGNYVIALGRNLTASISGTYTHGKSPLIALFKTDARLAGATLEYRPLKHLSISGGSNYYSRIDEPTDRVTGTSTFATVNYVTTW